MTKKPAKKRGKSEKAKAAPEKSASHKDKKAEVKSIGVSMYGMSKFFKMVHDEGRAKDLDAALKGTDKTVQVSHRTFKRMQKFVRAEPKLTEQHTIALEMSDCKCKHGDPFCICFDHHNSFADN